MPPRKAIRRAKVMQEPRAGKQAEKVPLPPSPLEGEGPGVRGEGQALAEPIPERATPPLAPKVVKAVKFIVQGLRGNQID